MIAGTLEPKRLELLREIAPKTSTVPHLVNPNNAGVLQDIPNVAAAAGKIGLGFEVVQAGSESEIDGAFATLGRDKAQALMIANDAFFTARASQIAALAARYSLPAVYPWREYAARRDHRVPGRECQSRDESDDAPSRAPNAGAARGRTRRYHQHRRCSQTSPG